MLQESDYMGVTFHFYDSDEEDDDGDEMPVHSQYVSKLGQSQNLKNKNFLHKIWLLYEN
jgi:hypothetical protein